MKEYFMAGNHFTAVFQSDFNMSSAENKENHHDIKAISLWPVVISNSLSSVICFVLEVKYSCCSRGLNDDILSLCSILLSLQCILSHFLLRRTEKGTSECVLVSGCARALEMTLIQSQKAILALQHNLFLRNNTHLNRIILLAKDVFTSVETTFLCEQIKSIA